LVKNISRILSLLVVLLAATSLWAQSGSISGQIHDPAGAVVPRAKVVALATATGVSHTTESNSVGLFSFPVLPPTSYDITVTAPGFKPTTRKGVTLTVAASIPLNVTLAVGGDATTISVTEAPNTAVESDTYQLSTVIDSEKINALPLVLRDPYQLVLLSPGTVTTSNAGGVSVNGQRDRNNNFMLDGADNNDTSVPGGLGGISSANPDSTQEFRVITNNFDAEFGRNTGAVVDVITRSGTNAFHGDAYEYGRYSAVGARDYFNTDTAKNPYVRNDFGASLGGPIWKDRTFFFLNAEVQKFRTTLTNTQTTPNAAYKAGKYTFIDPSDGVETAVDLTDTSNENNITGQGLDPTIQKILAKVPIGAIDNGDGVSTTYQFASPDPYDTYTLTGRFDHSLTPNEQLSVRYIYSHGREANNGHSEVLPGVANVEAVSTQHNGTVSLTSTFGTNKVNLFRAGYNQNNSGYYCKHAGVDSLLGVDDYGNGFDVTLPYFFTFGCSSLSDSNSQARLSSTLMAADTFTWTRGAHSIKFGGELRSVKDNDYDDFNSRMSYDFKNSSALGFDAWTDTDTESASYYNFQDLVFGAQGVLESANEYQFFNSKGDRRKDDYTHFRQHEWALFAQDTWKFNSRLTVIAGLRYAFNGVPYEKDANFSNLFQDASVAASTYGGAFTFTRVGPGSGHQLYKDSWMLFEPRVGFAYDLKGDGKTAIRGGFGIFHDRVYDNLFGNAKSNPPYQASYTDDPYYYYQSGYYSTLYTLSNYPVPGTLTPSSLVTDGTYLEPITIDNNLKIPANYSWNLGIQRQLTKNITAEITYVGSRTTHALREVDGAPPQPALVRELEDSGVAASALTKDSLYYTYGGEATYNTAFYHDLKQTSIGKGRYNALQAKLQGQIGDLNLLGTYTWGHSLDNSSDPLLPGTGNSGLPRNSFDLKPEYGNSDFDVRQRGTAALTYDLPIGKGKAYLSHGVLGVILANIELSGIEQIQTGLPFDLRGTRDNLHTGLSNRPELVSKPTWTKRGKATAYGKYVGVDVGSFANAPYDESVSIHRNTFHTTGYVDTDAVFQKTATIWHQVKLIFRAESYNLLNHPNMSAPYSGTIGSPYFGVATSEVQQNDGTTGARQFQGSLKISF